MLFSLRNPHPNCINSAIDFHMYSVFAFVFDIFRKIHIFGIVLYINFLKHSYDLTELRTDITLNRRSLACFNTHSYEVFIIMTIFGDLFFIFFYFF